MPRHDGPIIDAHHHLWDLGAGHYPWLTDPSARIAALGDYGMLRRSFLPDDYEAASEGLGIVATVHAEALWDPARHPAEETAWLEALPRPPGLAARAIAAADLTAADAAGVLDAHAAASGAVVAVRQTIRWHPDPGKSWTRRGIVTEEAWRRGLSAVTARGWALDLLMYPQQAEELAALARDVPDQVLVVNHCVSPAEFDEAGRRVWRDGLRAMARAPNVMLKLSNFARYAGDGGVEADRAIVRTCIDAFGVERCMFASDWPVSLRTAPLASLVERFRAAIAGLPPGEQRALFHDTAARVYRL